MLTIAQWRGATRTACGALLAAGALILAGSIALPAAAADPIKIGFSMGLTGGNAPNGNQLLLALETPSTRARWPSASAWPSP